MEILINDAVKRYLLAAPEAERRRLRKAFEYLECGMWEGGLRIKRLQGVSRAVLEARLNRGDRIVFTLGRSEADAALAYVWAVVPHDDVERTARAVAPENAPFLEFASFDAREAQDVDFEALEPALFTQELPQQRSQSYSGPQRWFRLDDAEWQRLLQYSKDELEIFLFLTPEQRELLHREPPLLLSGTAGSGKTTLSVYYLLRPEIASRPSLFLTYNRRLRNFCERLYRGLLQHREDQSRIRAAVFRTFEEFCIEILPDAASHFAPERKVNHFAFRNLFARHRLAEKYDAALVWEEIRSIIKGAKPQISARNLRRILNEWARVPLDTDLSRELQEEILAVARLSVREKAEAAMQRVVGCSLGDCARNLGRLLATENTALLRALQTVESQIEKHEADFNMPLMTCAEYEMLGHKRAPSFVHNREEIYAIAQWYQSRLEQEGLWDEIDLTRSVIRAIDRRAAKLPQYEFVCCDEVQDFTDIQLSLLVRLPRSPERLLLAGDPKQIINPSGFRWEEARGLFYERGLPVPPVHSLTLNFRCVGGIVALSNVLLKIKQELTGVRSEEKMDEWKFQGRPPVLVERVPADAMMEPLRVTGADRVILTREEAERDFLRRALGTELVFTIAEAKGLEFRSVVLWKFCKDAALEDLWSRILRAETAKIHDAVIRHEINLLYVGITRAQQNLVLYDGEHSSVVWNDPRMEELLFRTEGAEYLQEVWRNLSTPAEWKRQGDYFFENEHFAAARECYRNAGEALLMNRAGALACERRGEFGAAAAFWLDGGEPALAAACYERCGAWQDAAIVWEEVGNAERLLLCRIRILELDRRYAEAAELWEQAERWDHARELWHLAKRPDRIAQICEREGKIPEAAQFYASAGNPRRAAELYQEVGRRDDAARCWENAGEYGRARELWHSLNRKKDELACLERMGDPAAIAEFHEAAQDWKRALQSYRGLGGPNQPARWQEELDALTPLPRNAASRALRLSLLGRSADAAPLWEKARQHDLAATEYRAADLHQEAARCFARSRQWGEAILEYVRDREDPARSTQGMLSAARKVLRLDSTAGKTALETIADRVRKESRYAPALALYEMAACYIKAAECADLMGQPALRLGMLMREQDPEALGRCVLKKHWYGDGAEVVSGHLRQSRNPSFPLLRAFADILTAWHKNESDPDQREILARVVDENKAFIPLSMIVVVFESAGKYDWILNSIGSAAHRASPEELKDQLLSWFTEVRMKEVSGEMASAGIRYLLMQEKNAAFRCWSSVDVTDYNQECLVEAGHGERVLQYLERNEQYLEAAVTALDMDLAERSVELFRKAGELENGAELLESEKKYDQALELYRESGNFEKAATLLEKRLRRYEEAAAMWEKAGNRQRAQYCRGKIRRGGRKSIP